MTEEQKREALLFIVSAVVDAVKAAGSMGAPGGVIYAALMAHGCSFNQYTSLMGSLVRVGKLRREGELYFVGA